MAGTEAIHNPAIVLRSLIGIQNQQPDRRAGRPALEHAGKDLHLVGFPSLGRVPRLAGFAAVQVDAAGPVGRVPFPAGTIDDTTQRRPVALPETGDGKQFSEAVA